MTTSTTIYPLMAFRLSEQLRAAIATEARRRGVSKSSIVRDALLSHLPAGGDTAGESADSTPSCN